MLPAPGTPEGDSDHCPICGHAFRLEPSKSTHDAPCPQCRQLLGWFQTHLPEGKDEVISFDTELYDDSLDLVELIMEFEEEFGTSIPLEDAMQVQSIRDAIRYLQQRRDSPSAPIDHEPALVGVPRNVRYRLHSILLAMLAIAFELAIIRWMPLPAQLLHILFAIVLV